MPIWISPLIKFQGIQSSGEIFGNQKRDLFSLLNALYLILIPKDGIDSRVWASSLDGIFFVTSFFHSLPLASLPSLGDIHWDFLW